MSIDDSLVISCSSCTMRDTAACADCVVTFICERDPTDAVIINVDEARTLRLLHDVGLVPELRHAQA